MAMADAAMLSRPVWTLAMSASALARATSERDKLFSIIAHDLRSPFTVLLGNAEIIEEEAGVLSAEEIRTLARSMRESATAMFRLLQDLLVWAQLQLGSGEHRPRRLEIRDILPRPLDAVRGQRTRVRRQ